MVYVVKHVRDDIYIIRERRLKEGIKADWEYAVQIFVPEVLAPGYHRLRLVEGKYYRWGCF